MHVTVEADNKETMSSVVSGILAHIDSDTLYLASFKKTSAGYRVTVDETEKE
jgi:hypothetical protein